MLTEAEAELAASVTQGTPAWRTERAGRFTGSKMHLLMPSSRTAGFTQTADNYILQKAAELEAGRPLDEDINTKQMAHGIATEAEAFDAAAAAIYDRAGLTGIVHPGFLRWGDNAGASPDGLYEDLAIVEIKCPYSELKHAQHRLVTNSQALRKQSKDYWCQVQTEMAAAKVPRAFFVSYYKTPTAWQRNPYTGEMECLPIGPERTHIHIATIVRDDEFAETMLPRIEKAAALRDEYLAILKGGAQ